MQLSHRRYDPESEGVWRSATYVEPPHYSAGIAYRKDSRRDIAYNYAPGTDGSVIADRQTGADDRAAAIHIRLPMVIGEASSGPAVRSDESSGW
jgi:hypothetical protein